MGPAKIARLRANTAIFRRGLEAAGVCVLGDRQSPVVPMLLLNTWSMNRFSRSRRARGTERGHCGGMEVGSGTPRVRRDHPFTRTDGFARLLYIELK